MQLRKIKGVALESLRDPVWAANFFTRRVRRRFLATDSPEFRRYYREILGTGHVDGWRHREDLSLLYHLAREVRGTGTVVEIGSFKGLATIALALGTRDGQGGVVHTVDPHTGDRQDLEGRGLDELSSLDAFQANIKWAGVEPIVRAYTMTSNELSDQWSGGRVRLLFVDGWHSYDAVRDDLIKWVPRLAKNCAVVIDDYANYDEVKRAVDDHAAILPPHQQAAGRMYLAHTGLPSARLERFLRIPWG